MKPDLIAFMYKIRLRVKVFPPFLSALPIIKAIRPSIGQNTGVGGRRRSVLYRASIAIYIGVRTPFAIRFGMTDHESWLSEKMSDRGGSLIASPLALIQKLKKKKTLVIN